MSIIQILNKIKLIEFINAEDYKKKVKKVLAQNNTKLAIESSLNSLFPKNISETEFKSNYLDIQQINNIQANQLAGDIEKSIIDKVLELRKSGLENTIEDAITKIVKQKQFQIRTLSNTTQIAISRAVTFKDSKPEDKFKLVGPKFNARTWCLTHLNKIYTLKEIEKMDNNQGLSVKHYCGGYNCKHRWLKVS